jgi:hypothetical protein
MGEITHLQAHSLLAAVADHRRLERMVQAVSLARVEMEQPIALQVLVLLVRAVAVEEEAPKALRLGLPGRAAAVRVVPLE